MSMRCFSMDRSDRSLSSPDATPQLHGLVSNQHYFLLRTFQPKYPAPPRKMIGRIALMNPKATQTTKTPIPSPMPVFLTIAWLSSVIISHLGSGMSRSAVPSLYASISGWCHVFLRMSVQMPFELELELSCDIASWPQKQNTRGCT